jgi:hypothetical protein
MPRHENKTADDVIVSDPDAGMRKMDAALRHILTIPKPHPTSAKKHRKHKK